MVQYSQKEIKDICDAMILSQDEDIIEAAIESVVLADDKEPFMDGLCHVVKSKVGQGMCDDVRDAAIAAIEEALEEGVSPIKSINSQNETVQDVLFLLMLTSEDACLDVQESLMLCAKNGGDVQRIGDVLVGSLYGYGDMSDKENFLGDLEVLVEDYGYTSPAMRVALEPLSQMKPSQDPYYNRVQSRAEKILNMLDQLEQKNGLSAAGVYGAGTAVANTLTDVVFRPLRRSEQNYPQHWQKGQVYDVKGHITHVGEQGNAPYLRRSFNDDKRIVTIRTNADINVVDNASYDTIPNLQIPLLKITGNNTAEYFIQP